MKEKKKFLSIYEERKAKKIIEKQWKSKYSNEFLAFLNRNAPKNYYFIEEVIGSKGRIDFSKPVISFGTLSPMLGSKTFFLKLCY